LVRRPNKDLIEVFGYAPDDLSRDARSLWNLSACPFTRNPCTKTNHDKTIRYGTCSVTSPHGDCVICPNRMYESDHQVIRRVSNDAFGTQVPFLMYDEYVEQRTTVDSCIVALGQNTGREVQVGKSLSID